MKKKKKSITPIRPYINEKRSYDWRSKPPINRGSYRKTPIIKVKINTRIINKYPFTKPNSIKMKT
jgi:hypothetical protein